MAHLTRDERSDIIGQFASALDQNTRDLAALAIRQKYEDCEDTTRRLEAYGLVGSLESLYRLCPRGTELGFVLMRASDTRRYYKVIVGSRGATGRFEASPITGYILDLDIGKESKSGNGTYVLSTTGDANTITTLLSHTLYGNAYALTYRTL
ncbi:MAG: hypothetical protein ACXWP0_01205 [Ktedonobacterales bacterium]